MDFIELEMLLQGADEIRLNFHRDETGGFEMLAY